MPINQDSRRHGESCKAGWENPHVEFYLADPFSTDACICTSDQTGQAADGRMRQSTNLLWLLLDDLPMQSGPGTNTAAVMTTFPGWAIWRRRAEKGM